MDDVITSSPPNTVDMTVNSKNIYIYCDNIFYNVSNVRKMKPGQKLRLKKGFLVIENRPFAKICRKMSRDNRYTILSHLQKDTPYLPKNQKNYAIECLQETYKDDIVFLKELSKLLTNVRPDFWSTNLKIK